MDDADEAQFRAWTMHKRLASRATRQAAEALRVAITPAASQAPPKGRLTRALAVVGR
jgi:hypothetical protein